MPIKEKIDSAKYVYTKKDNTYLTPPSLIQRGLQLLAVHKKLPSVEKFDLDVCCSDENIPAKEYFKSDSHNGLYEPWRKYNWCNPPFDECKKWVQKAFGEQQSGNTTIMLIPARTETAYFHDYILHNENVEIIWLRKGYRFLNPQTKEPMGIFKNALCLVLFKGIEK